MLKLTLEIIPGGCEPAKRTIGIMKITNISKDFTPDDALGDYKFNFTTETIRHDGKLLKWPRSLGAWKLVQACLKACQGEIPIRKGDDDRDS